MALQGYHPHKAKKATHAMSVFIDDPQDTTTDVLTTAMQAAMHARDEYGVVMVPCGPDKQPLARMGYYDADGVWVDTGSRWGHLQYRLPTNAEIQRLFDPTFGDDWNGYAVGYIYSVSDRVTPHTDTGWMPDYVSRIAELDLDVDKTGDPNSHCDAVLSLIPDADVLLNAPVVRTAGGGMHLVVRTPETGDTWKSRTGDNALYHVPGHGKLELKTTGFVAGIASGNVSHHNQWASTYEQEQASFYLERPLGEIPMMPAALIAHIESTQHREDGQRLAAEATSAVAVEDRIRQASAFVDRQDIVTANRDKAVMVMAARLTRGFDLPDDDALELLRRFNAEKIQPSLDDATVSAKVAKARRTMTRIRIGSLLDTQQWRRAGEGGRIIANDNANMRQGLRLLGYSLAYNQFNRRVYTDEERTQPVTNEWNDIAINALADHFGFKPSLDQFRSFVRAEAHKQAFHPVRDYLTTNLAAYADSGVPDMSDWMVAHFGADDSTPAAQRIARIVGRILLVSSVARIMEPGARVQTMAVLEGGQGIGKSTGLMALCPDVSWCLEDGGKSIRSASNGDVKDLVDATRGKWLVEWAELAGLSRTEEQGVKGVLSRQVDTTRLSYQPEAQDYPRQFVIVGTTNETVYLRDQTGNRRYLPVRITGTIDVARVAEVRADLWAWAMQQYLAGVPYHVTRDEEAILADEQQQRQVSDPLTDALRDVLGAFHTTPYLQDGEVRIKQSELFASFAEHAETHLTTFEKQRVTTLMVEQGYSKRDTRPHGASRYTSPSVHWVRTTTSTAMATGLED